MSFDEKSCLQVCCGAGVLFLFLFWYFVFFLLYLFVAFCLSSFWSSWDHSLSFWWSWQSASWVMVGCTEGLVSLKVTPHFPITCRKGAVNHPSSIKNNKETSPWSISNQETMVTNSSVIQLSQSNMHTNDSSLIAQAVESTVDFHSVFLSYKIRECRWM